LENRFRFPERFRGLVIATKSPSGRLAKREECLVPREKPNLFAIPERERTVAIELHFIGPIANRQFPGGVPSLAQ
jgi:hypothetical protein